jgi:uncharacterized membrane protein YccC
VTASPSDAEAPGVWKDALRASLRVDWAGAEPLAALRCTIGVGLPLGIALAAGQPGAGMFAAIGAVSAGFGSFQGAYRSRAAIMLFAVVGMAVSLMVGSLAGHSSLTTTLMTAAWGLGAGLLVSLGQGASFVGLQSSVALIVAAAYPSPLAEAIGRGLLVLAGGLLQVVLVVSVWPLRRFSAERHLIARVYRSLADYATTLATGDLLPPEPHTLAGTAPPDADPQPFARSSELLVFRGLYDEAERIRAALAALSLSPARADEMLAVHAVVLLRELADAVDDGRAPERLDAHWAALERRAADLQARGMPVDALVSQMRAAFRMATVPAAQDDPTLDRASRARAFPPVRQAFVTLGANLSFRSTAFRHAVRLAVTLAVATALARAYALPRGYWFPMTALLVLKPEFRETFVTGITRVIGTLAGAGVAALLVEVVGADPTEVTVLLLLFVWAGYTLFRASYTLFTVCITGYIVLLLYLAHAPGPATATYRTVDTVLGGLLALVVFRAWPTWEAWRAPEVVARQCEMLARYTSELLGTYAAPERWDPKRLGEARAAARLARSNSEASVERLLGEPVAPGDWRGRLGLGVLAALRRYSLGALALHAPLETGPPEPVPQLAPIRDCLVERLLALAAFMRGEHDVERLQASCRSDVPRPALDRVLSEQIDLLIESLDNVAELMSTSTQKS